MKTWTQDALRRKLRHDPFTPFEVLFKDGRRWTCRQPYTWLIGKTWLATVDRSGNSRDYALKDISSVRLLGEPWKVPSNRASLEKLAVRVPFKPFEVRFEDGQRWTCRSPRTFVVSNASIHAVDRKGCLRNYELRLIAKIRPLSG